MNATNSIRILGLMFTILAVLYITLIYSPVSFAQQNPGMLVGLVNDQNGARIPDAKINIESKNLKKEIRSDAEGVFQIDLPAGTYQVSVESYGFRTFKRKDVQIRTHSTKALDAVLYAKPMKPYKCPKGQEPCIML